MSAMELQTLLVRRIKTIKNIEFLNAIKILTDIEKKSEVYYLNNFEKEKISMASTQIRKGQIHSNDDVFNEIEKWLNAK